MKIQDFYRKYKIESLESRGQNLNKRSYIHNLDKKAKKLGVWVYICENKIKEKIFLYF